MLFDWFGGNFGRDGGPSASGATALCNKPLSRMRERAYERSGVPMAEVVVDGAVAGQAAGEFAVRIGAAHRVDLGDVRWVASEFEDHAIWRGRIDRFAIAVIGLAERFAGSVEPRL